MNSLAIIIIFLIILVISVIAITVVQKKEQAKAERARRIGQYRYRANNAINVLNNLAQLPVGKDTRTLMLQYALTNLKAVAQLSPGDLTNEKSIRSLSKQLQVTQSPVDNAKLKIPEDRENLNKQITQLSNLVTFLTKLKQSNTVSKELIPKAVNQILSLITESKICAYIRLGKESLAKHQYIPAQGYFSTAQQTLDKSTNKNTRIQQLEIELRALMTASPEEVKNTEFLLDDNEAQDWVKDERDTEKPDELFGPKKKW